MERVMNMLSADHVLFGHQRDDEIRIEQKIEIV